MKKYKKWVRNAAQYTERKGISHDDVDDNDESWKINIPERIAMQRNEEEGIQKTNNVKIFEKHDFGYFIDPFLDIGGQLLCVTGLVCFSRIAFDFFSLSFLNKIFKRRNN